ncbi:M42 family metallopeptidase [Chitinophaga pinensis]|uniref:Peptidase M42 family protein n=1 Tax=Chitinophaga pinensis (strain ATCC 43595 / DSM 2588 / LMG 13176 / NBRC 15968 / NCIMB 11800 / UQM 2034) TaxID=485918 RepID=A0A979G334_CHIPD|nr:M42 family metallopeptidase [Chitinophaga pinensis]ACU59837.1 peptidase M42 family protein [Chitinophaga pinensis DSM 2588]
MSKKQKSILSKEALTFLRTYLNNPSPTGFEKEGQKLWLEYLKPYIDEQYVDAYGSAVGIINPKAPFKVVIEAHADEISWFVNYISPEGLIYVIRNGGSDQQIAPSKRVHIHTEKGIVKAVFGWPAIHTRLRSTEGKDPQPKVENIFLDCGARNRKEVEDLGIHVGCVVTFEDGFEELNYDYFICRALDNRIGGFMIAEVARMLKEKKQKLPFGLYIVNAVQEEVGLRGAEMIAKRIKPDVAIITDVTHDSTTPMINKNIEGEIRCGAGPSITYGPAVHNILRDLIIDTAKKNDIPFQRHAVSRSTGTDTDAFAYSNDGTPSALISIPLRYMHTTVEMIKKDDIENTIQLIYQTLLNITPKTNFKYL